MNRKSSRLLVGVVGVMLSVSGTALAAQRTTGATPDRAIGRPVTLEHEGAFLDKLARVGSDLYVAGQPTADALRQLYKQGVRTVVNLRTPAEMKQIGFDEEALVRSLGMTYVYLPVRGDSAFPFTPQTVTRFAAALRASPGAVLLHCTVAWRASHLWAAYLVRERGVPVDSAIVWARSINLMDDMRHTDGRQPLEDFLNQDISALKHVTGKPNHE